MSEFSLDHLTTGQIERIARKFEEPGSFADALILRGAQAEIARRDLGGDPETVIEDLEGELDSLESILNSGDTIANKVDAALERVV